MLKILLTHFLKKNKKYAVANQIKGASSGMFTDGLFFFRD